MNQLKGIIKERISFPTTLYSKQKYYIFKSYRDSISSRFFRPRFRRPRRRCFPDRVRWRPDCCLCPGNRRRRGRRRCPRPRRASCHPQSHCEDLKWRGKLAFRIISNRVSKQELGWEDEYRVNKEIQLKLLNVITVNVIGFFLSQSYRSKQLPLYKCFWFMWSLL